MNGKFKKHLLINVFTFDQFNASLLDTIINSISINKLIIQFSIFNQKQENIYKNMTLCELLIFER